MNKLAHKPVTPSAIEIELEWPNRLDIPDRQILREIRWERDLTNRLNDAVEFELYAAEMLVEEIVNGLVEQFGLARHRAVDYASRLPIGDIEDWTTVRWVLTRDCQDTVLQRDL